MNETLYRKNLLLSGLVTEDMLRRAEHAAEEGEAVDETLQRLGDVTLADVYAALASKLRVPLVDLSRFTPSPLVRKMIPDWVCIRDGILPLKCDAATLKLAMVCPNDLAAVENAAFASDRRILPMLATREDIRDLHSRLFEPDTGPELAPAVQVVNKMLRHAFLAGASDIHMEPHAEGTEVRMRIDGEMQELMQVPGNLMLPTTGRVKILANMDLAKRHEPQDGSFSAKLGTRRFDVRVSTIPVPNGEKVVMRLLDPRTSNTELSDLGMLDDIEQSLQALLQRPQGLIIVTGPTGSGKSTTLCSILNALKQGSRTNIVSVENPIEYQIAGINQIQVNVRQGLTFATALRSILRQDPDVISIGEIRDEETALIAHHAAETGHLVFSTLHTNDAPSAVTRLIDLGVAPFVVSSSLTAVLAQRLVRRTCRKCAEPAQPTPEEAATLAGLNLAETATLTRGRGCARCANTGYRGRIAVNELLQIDLDLRGRIALGASSEEIYAEARKAGFRTMWETGLVFVARGVTTLEEMRKRVPPSPDTPVPGVPAVQRVATAMPVPATAPATRFAEKLRLLIADDDPAILKVVARALTPLDAEVFTVDNGEDAIRVALEKNLSLIITDLDMPLKSGFEVTEILRGQETTAAVPIIMLTANVTEQAEVDGIECGADDFLTKPFSPRALLARVKAVLRRSQMSAAIAAGESRSSAKDAAEGD